MAGAAAATRVLGHVGVVRDFSQCGRCVGVQRERCRLTACTKVACPVLVESRTRDVARFRGRRDMSPTYPRFGLRVVRVSAVSVATVLRDGPITYLLTYVVPHRA